MLKSRTVLASGIPTKFSPENFDEFCDSLILILQEEQAGNISKISNEEIFAMADKLLEYKCITVKQHSFLFLKRVN